MTAWQWLHSEYHTHKGWVPQISARIFRNGDVESHTVNADPELVLDTKGAARDVNRQLAQRHAREHDLQLVPAENE